MYCVTANVLCTETPGSMESGSVGNRHRKTLFSPLFQGTKEMSPLGGWMDGLDMFHLIEME